MYRDKDSFLNKIPFLYFLLILCFVILVFRLWFLQIHKYNEFKSLAEDNTIRSIPMPSERGQIFSGDNEILVKNSIYFKLSLLGIEVENISEMLDKISEITPLTKEDREYLKKRVAERSLDPILVKDMLDYVTFCRLSEIKADYPGIMLEVQPIREYPFKTLACHVLGYDGPVTEEELKEGKGIYASGDFTGRDGIEKKYDKELRGHKGAAKVRVDVFGGLVDSVGTVYPKPGDTLYLTIDTKLQAATEKALKNAVLDLEAINGEKSGGAALVLNANTGAVLAMASYPIYDPNKFARGISQKDYDSLIQNTANPLLNRPIHGAYPCASTFKLITASAGLQEKLISANQYFYCSGSYDLHGHIFNCFVTTGHGGISFYEVMAYSCDVVFYQMANKFKLEKFLSYISEFGIGKKTGIDLPGENSGILPSPEWKKKNYDEDWYPGDTVNLSIGQGFIEVTPLQVARFTMAVANGGKLYKPYVVRQINSFSGDVVKVTKPINEHTLSISEANLNAVREGMKDAVLYGTAKRAYCDFVSIAGKTGTAENFPTPENPHGRNHTWFTSFAPYNKPEIVVTVLLEKSGGYGGEYSAKVAKRIYEAKYRNTGVK